MVVTATKKDITVPSNVLGKSLVVFCYERMLSAIIKLPGNVLGPSSGNVLVPPSPHGSLRDEGERHDLPALDREIDRSVHVQQRFHEFLVEIHEGCPCQPEGDPERALNAVLGGVEQPCYKNCIFIVGSIDNLLVQ